MKKNKVRLHCDRDDARAAGGLISSPPHSTSNVIKLPRGKYQIIYADPPWDYRGRKQFGFAGDVGVDSGGAVMHYKTMKLKEIIAMSSEIERISGDALKKHQLKKAA